jgi:glucokinase
VLEEVCREWPAFDRSRLANEAVLNFETLFRSKDAGDDLAREVLQHSFEVWAALTVSLIHAYGLSLFSLAEG